MLSLCTAHDGLDITLIYVLFWSIGIRNNHNNAEERGKGLENASIRPFNYGGISSSTCPLGSQGPVRNRPQDIILKIKVGAYSITKPLKGSYNETTNIRMYSYNPVISYVFNITALNAIVSNRARV